MKRVLTSLFLACVLTLGPSVYAQDEEYDTTNTEVADSSIVGDEGTDTEQNSTLTSLEEGREEEESIGHQWIKDKFIEGDPTFMAPVLICLILGLAIAIERIITLNLASVNEEKLLGNVKKALEDGGVNSAVDVTKATRGPVASIFTQGLMRYSESIEMVEKSIVSYGSVEMGRLERGLVWISLFISLAPMLGFMGTVIGMIGAFDAIEAAGDISPSLVAGGIKIALLTTVGGLIVAIILQIFYNYCIAKIDAIVNQMENASISLVDVLVRHKETKE